MNLRKLRGSAIRLRNTTSQRCISEEARNTYSELAIRHEGIDAGIIGLRSLKFKRCAELDGAARLRLTFALISSVRHNHPFTGGNVILCDFVRANRFFTGGDDISVVEVTKM